MAAGAARQGGSGHASARANTKGQGAGVLMSDDNGVPKLQLRAPDRDHGPEDGPDTMDEGQVRVERGVGELLLCHLSESSPYTG
jgi:hypothetical protein